MSSTRPWNPLSELQRGHYGVGLRPGDFIVGDVVIKGTSSGGSTVDLPAAAWAALETLGLSTDE